VEELKKKYSFTAENAEAILQKEVGEVFKTVLEHAGVFKRDERGRAAFVRFAGSVN
jgi:UDPglucose--hexose-1-phosphate uridylyltransferase